VSPVAKPLAWVKLAPHAPVIRRTATEFQVGLDPRTALVFDGWGFGVVLDALDGQHSADALRALGQASGLTGQQLTWTVSRLRDAGLLVAPRDPDVTTRRVRLIGAGPVGAHVAGHLAATGVELHIYDDDPPDPMLYPAAGALARRSDALCAAIATPAQPVSHWSKPETVPMDLTVICLEGPEVDRVITDHLVRSDQPHLLVRSSGDGVCVGPLVLPGLTSCVQCADLARRDADPHWPIVLAQLSRLRLSPPPMLLSWAASVAAVQALCFLRGGAPETVGSTLELSATDLITRMRTWPAHAECGCGWMSPTE